jgi:hypothetical protein
VCHIRNKWYNINYNFNKNPNYSSVYEVRVGKLRGMVMTVPGNVRNKAKDKNLYNLRLYHCTEKSISNEFKYSILLQHMFYKQGMAFPYFSIVYHFWNVNSYTHTHTHTFDSKLEKS